MHRPVRTRNRPSLKELILEVLSREVLARICADCGRPRIDTASPEAIRADLARAKWATSRQLLRYLSKPQVHTVAARVAAPVKGHRVRDDTRLINQLVEPGVPGDQPPRAPSMTDTSARNLCRRILSAVVAWPAVDAALQSGGLETKARGVYANAIAEWLADEGRGDRVVLPEYSPAKQRRVIDFSVIRKEHVAAPVLTVETLFEVKFNYAKHAAPRDWIAKRLGDHNGHKHNAIRQARNYQKLSKALHAYVLYLIAAPATATKPDAKTPKLDSGWPYYDKPEEVSSHIGFAKTVIEHLVEAHQPLEPGQPPARITGHAEIAAGAEGNPRNCAFYCCLIAV